MTFEEAHDILNHGDWQTVADQMKTWHPAILGQMLIAVDEAKEQRYKSHHPDYEGVLTALAKRREEELK